MDAPDGPDQGPPLDADESPAGGPEPGRTVRLARRCAPTLVVVVLLAALGVRRYLADANADALLPALMSTQQWTLFYWGQDRLANLVALVAMPVRDPIWNFELQSILIASAFFGLAAVFVSYHAWSRRDQARPVEHAVATALTGLVALLPFHTVAGYRFLIEQLYFVSVLVWVVAVWAWQRRRRYVWGAVLLLVCTLVNPSLLLASPLVWLVDDEPERRWRRSAGFVGASVGAFVLTDIASRSFATGEDLDLPYDEFRIDRLEEGVRAVTGNIAGSVRDHLATVVVVLAVGIVLSSTRRLRSRSVAVYAAVPVFSGAWLLLFSTNGWVAQNLYEFRYFYPLYVTYLLFVAAASTELVLATRRWRPSLEQGGRRGPAIAWTEVALVAAASGLAVLVAHRTEVPALTVTDEPVAAARELDVLLVAGNYWTTWPTVVDGRGEGLPLLGVTFRSDPIVDEIHRELATAAERGGALVLCSGVDAPDCVALVNERSPDVTWAVDQVVRDWPLVIRIVPVP